MTRILCDSNWEKEEPRDRGGDSGVGEMEE
jgi:hypothetical protein